jgi:hypothetical protein
MPRYYFSILRSDDGDELQADDPEELPSDEAAKAIAERTACELARNAHALPQRRLLVKDESGCVVYDVALGPGG